MIIRRRWNTDLRALASAEAMDRQGIRVVAIIPPGEHSKYWDVWGQADEGTDIQQIHAADDFLEE